jgi:preprotein translocase subunit YajC
MSLLLSSVVAATSKNANPLVSFAPIILIGVVMYFLLIRPNKRRQRDAMALLKQIQEGDEVITTGGIYGFINAIDGDTVWLDIADNVEIRIHRSSISRKIDPTKEPAGGPAVTTDDTAAKPASRFTKFQKAAPKPDTTGDPDTLADPVGLDAPADLDAPSLDDNGK